MNDYIKPEMKITYFGDTAILTESAVSPPFNPTYAANNMNHYMVGTTVKAIQTRTVAVRGLLGFSNGTEQ